MNLNKTLLLAAVAMAITACAKPQIYPHAAEAPAEPAPTGNSEEIGYVNTSYGVITRHSDAANNVACYTVRNGNGGFNISCVKL